MGNKIKIIIYKIIYGSSLMEKVLLYFLGKYYDAQFFLQWCSTKDLPHFEDWRIFGFRFLFERNNIGPYPFVKGSYTSESIREGDLVLDICSGDGFFANKYYSFKASLVDCIDHDESSQWYFDKFYSTEKVKFYHLDLLKDELPDKKYDAVIWDGAIGHFDKEEITFVLNKIKKVIKKEGILIGSESMLDEGHDHKTFFYNLEDVNNVFKGFFKFVEVKSMDYELRWASNYKRKEAFWKCSNSRVRLEEAKWIIFEN